MALYFQFFILWLVVVGVASLLVEALTHDFFSLVCNIVGNSKPQTVASRAIAIEQEIYWSIQGVNWSIVPVYVKLCGLLINLRFLVWSSQLLKDWIYQQCWRSSVLYQQVYQQTVELSLNDSSANLIRKFMWQNEAMRVINIYQNDEKNGHSNVKNCHLIF